MVLAPSVFISENPEDCWSATLLKVLNSDYTELTISDRIKNAVKVVNDSKPKKGLNLHDLETRPAKNNRKRN